MAKDENGLTPKQEAFVQEYNRTGNGVKSALAVYNIKNKDYNTANVIAVENLQKPTIVKRVKSIAERIPDNLLVKKHLELLNVPRKVRKFSNGKLLSEYEEVDSFAISKGLDMAYKLKSVYAPEKVQHSGAIKFGRLQEADNDELIELAESGSTEPLA